jgi:uncharacterized protein (TIGR02246 family)
MNVTEPVHAFIAAINRHDVDRLCQLMTDDHVFIDSLGGEARGRDTLRRAWRGYFALIPDYTLEIEALLVSGDTVVGTGMASGTYAPDGKLKSENAWRIPIAIRAAVDAKRVNTWQVFADNEPVRQAVRRHEIPVHSV